MRTLVEANPSLSHRWRNGTADLWAPIESRTLDWRMGFGLQTARTGLRYRNPVIERTAIKPRVERASVEIFNLGRLAMPRGPRSEKASRRRDRRGPIRRGSGTSERWFGLIRWICRWVWDRMCGRVEHRSSRLRRSARDQVVSGNRLARGGTGGTGGSLAQRP